MALNVGLVFQSRKLDSTVRRTTSVRIVVLNEMFSADVLSLLAQIDANWN